MRLSRLTLAPLVDSSELERRPFGVPFPTLSRSGLLNQPER